MRFPSVAGAIAGAGASFRRFPMVLLSGLAACWVAIRMIDGPSNDSRDWMPRFLGTATMGIALFTAAGTSAERFRLKPAGRWLLDAVAAAVLVTIFLLSLTWTDPLATLRFIQLLVLAHLFAAVGPCILGDHANGFWQYNRLLLLRFLTAAFFAAVLFAGLSIALAALDKLFGVDVPSESYGYLMAILAFVFHPWFFLAGVPDDYAALDTLDDYPRMLKAFSQFVLIPLVTVYLVILTAYLGKVLITRTWPSGWIGYLVSSVSAAGVLAVLLVHPVRRSADSPWVATFSRWWFVVLLPSLAMLLLAVGKRIGQYGMTEERYFLLALSLWMLGIALYFGFGGSARIKRIPETLLLVTLVTAFGPWGAYSVSVRSQTARLANILERHGMGRPGSLTQPLAPVPFEDRVQLSAILRYLVGTHGPGTLARTLGVPEDTTLTWIAQGNLDEALVQAAMRRIGVEYVGGRWARPEQNRFFWAGLETPRTADIAGFQVMRSLLFPAAGWIGTATDSLEVSTDTASGRVTVRHAGVPIMTLDVAATVIQALPADSLGVTRNPQLSGAIVVDGSGGGYRVRIVLEAVQGQFVGEHVRIHGGNGVLLAAGFKRPD